ncbi:diguanylate cyclase domain-containing protein, partial [Kitasatospora sp. NPDC059800]|uniref:diguanylate cyclase domain-containing protein n=1 Tax=Kitasatospora sp. NPDC059800 TaxID=3346951 RepID=UPI003659FE7A
VARLLASACRDSDMPARTGGEEFALLLNDTRLDEAAQVCAPLVVIEARSPEQRSPYGTRSSVPGQSCGV